MSILNHITTHELQEYKVLKQRMLKATSTEEIRYYENKIHDIFDKVEYRTIIDLSIELGRLEIIRNMLKQGMTMEDVIPYTPYSISELKVKLDESRK